MIYRKTAELFPGIFWIGAGDTHTQLHSNSYLLIEGKEGTLIDPGSACTFEAVADAVRSILPIEELSCIALLNPDADGAGSAPLFERAGFSGPIASSQYTSLKAAYYGINSSFYLLEDHSYSISFSSGRELEFITAPYLHFPGAVMAFDSASGFLFSGSLFSTLRKKRKLFADETYLDEMMDFHRQYMPSQEALAPVMKRILTRNIKAICPQHGSVIRKNIRSHITALRDLKCGYLLSSKPEVIDIENDTEYTLLINRCLEKLISSFGKTEVLTCFQDSEISVHSESGEAYAVNGSFHDAWNSFFNQIYAYGGHRWLALVEPLMERLISEFSVPRPDIFLSTLIEEKKKSSKLSEEKEYLEAVNASLRGNLDLAMEEMTKDQLTGLYNENFLVKYLLNIFNEIHWNNFDIYFIQVDHMKQLNETIGEQKGNELLSGIGSLLLNEKKEDDYLFRIGGPVFVLISPRLSEWNAVVQRAEQFKNIASHERRFLEQITVSVGIITVEYDHMSQLPTPTAMENIFSKGKMLLRTASRNGGNRVETRIEEDELDAHLGRVVIVDYDRFNAQLIGDSLETLSIDYRICMDGPDAIRTISEFHPDVIISELFLLETDAFSLKEELDLNSKTSGIPFILVSHQKNESAIVRAISLGIVHYLKKPYVLPELLGIINTYVLKAMKHV